jgi:hypothetical protein
MLRTVIQRRAVRRAVQTSCQAVDVSEFQLIAERVVDLSTRGMLVACGARTRVGNRVVVSFLAPTQVGQLAQEDSWFDAEAVVARIVDGEEWSLRDGGYGAGLEFTYFEKSCRHELLSRLAGYPPPVPKRPALDEYNDFDEYAELDSSLLARPIVIVQDPAVPVARRRLKVPAGAFAC